MKLSKFCPIVAVTSVAALLAACGSTTSSSSTTTTANATTQGTTNLTVAQIAAYNKPDRQTLLVNGAKSEQTVTWYTTIAGPIIQAIEAGFHQAYPFLTLKVYRNGSAGLATQELNAFKANQPGADVFGGDFTDTISAMTAGIPVPYYSPNVLKEPTDFRNTNSSGLTTWATVVNYYIGFGYNTTLVSGPPATLQDFLSPTYKGKLGLSASSGIYWVAYMLLQPNGSQIIQQMEKTQNVTVQNVSGAALASLIAKGQTAASPDIFRSHALELAAAGSPVKWATFPGNETIALPEYLTVSSKAPHPYAAMLLTDFLTSSAMKSILHKYYYLSPTEPPPGKVILLDTPKSNPATVSQNEKNWVNIVQNGF